MSPAPPRLAPAPPEPRPAAMPTAASPPPGVPGPMHPIVRGLLLAMAPEMVGADLGIHPDDEMLGFSRQNHQGDSDLALAEYVQSGLRVVASLRQLVRWRFGSWSNVRNVLDFASGYGRVTRFLVRELPPERVTVSEIVEPALAFQHERFGVRTLASAIEPGDVATDERFDLVIVTSLFTHLPRQRFGPWLRRMRELLAPGGMLVMTTHDLWLLPPGTPPPADGFAFQAISESQVLETADYGSTWVTEAYVREALGEIDRDLASLRIPRGLCNFQDLWAIVAPGGADPGQLAYERDPDGHLDACRRDGRRLQLYGWAAYRGRESELARVEVHLGGERVAVCEEFFVRPDVAAALAKPGLRCGFDLTVELGETQSLLGTPLVVRAVTRGGHAHAIYAGTVATAELHTARGDVAYGHRVIQEKKELAERFEFRTRQLASRVQELESRVAAMEASKFWKLRNAWFAVKRALFLTKER